MKHALLAIPIALLALGCGKGELDPASLTSNPFDADYDGPAVFVFDSTYTQNVTIPGGIIVNQVIAFHVKAELLPPNNGYSVRVVETATGDSTLIDPIPSDNNRFRYSRANPVVGALCVRLGLHNNNATSRREEICATL